MPLWLVVAQRARVEVALRMALLLGYGASVVLALGARGRAEATPLPHLVPSRLQMEMELCAPPGGPERLLHGPEHHDMPQKAQRSVSAVGRGTGGANASLWSLAAAERLDRASD